MYQHMVAVVRCQAARGVLWSRGNTCLTVWRRRLISSSNLYRSSRLASWSHNFCGGDASMDRSRCISSRDELYPHPHCWRRQQGSWVSHSNDSGTSYFDARWFVGVPCLTPLPASASYDRHFATTGKPQLPPREGAQQQPACGYSRLVIHLAYDWRDYLIILVKVSYSGIDLLPGFILHGGKTTITPEIGW